MKKTVRYNDGTDVPAIIKGEVTVDGKWVVVHHRSSAAAAYSVTTEIPVHNVYSIRSFT